MNTISIGTNNCSFWSIIKFYNVVSFIPYPIINFNLFLFFTFSFYKFVQKMFPFIYCVIWSYIM